MASANDSSAGWAWLWAEAMGAEPPFVQMSVIGVSFRAAPKAGRFRAAQIVRSKV